MKPEPLGPDLVDQVAQPAALLAEPIRRDTPICAT